MFEYHLSYSNGLFYAFAYDECKRPSGRFKSPDFMTVIDWITSREEIVAVQNDGANRLSFSFSQEWI